MSLSVKTCEVIKMAGDRPTANLSQELKKRTHLKGVVKYSRHPSRGSKKKKNPASGIPSEEGGNP
jgi:hypothetical protein